MPSSTMQAAIEYANKKFAQVTSNSEMWPTLNHKEVHSGLINRIKAPEMIWQAKTNLCGMATFFNTLATDDPYFYAYYVQSMYRRGSAYLGYSKYAEIAKAGKLVRSCDPPPNMAQVDWLALSSLRDYLNQSLEYGYKIGVPFVKEIPLFGLPFSDHFLETLGAYTMPEDLEAMLRAVGWSAENLASSEDTADAVTLGKVNSYFSKGHKVLLLASPGIFSHDYGGSSAPKAAGAMLHWVRLISLIDFKSKHFKTDGEDGLRFRAYNPGGAGTQQDVPFNGTYMRRSVFLDNFYGFIAARK